MTVQTEIRKAVKELIEKGNDLFPTAKLNYNSIEIRFSLYGKSRTGYAWYNYDGNGNSILNFHPAVAQQNPQAYIDQTVSHEVSHLFQSKLYPTSKPHGREFQRVAQKLGNSGRRCSSYNMSQIKGKAKKRFVYTCDCMTHKVTKQKHDKLQMMPWRYTCTRCHSDLRWTGKEITVY